MIMSNIDQNIKKYNKIDNGISFVRFISTIMIVICHIFQFYKNDLAIWFNVAVQIFLFMSGWLYGLKEDNKGINFVFKNLVKILVDYYLLLIFVIPIYLIFAPSYMGIKQIFLLAFGANASISGIGHLWYIPYICLCYIITPILERIAQFACKFNTFKYIAICFGVSLFTIGLLMSYHSYFIPAWVICYMLGFFMARAKNKYSCFKNKLYLLVILPFCISLNGFRIFVTYFYNGERQQLLSKLLSFVQPYAHVCLGISLFFVLYFIGKKISKLKIKPLNYLLRWSDKHSYQIYLTHQILILGPFSIFAVMNKFVIPFIILVIYLIVSSSILKFLSTKVLVFLSQRIKCLAN